jgi:hypothetical protein
MITIFPETMGFGTSLGGGLSLLGAGGMSAAEGAAATMLAAVVLVVALVGFSAWILARRSRRPDPTLQFLEHLDRSRKPSPPPPTRERTRPSESAHPSWEKPDDWWKK